MLSRFTNQYQLSKTLRFELRPLGKTKEYIEQNALIQEDEERAEKYEKVKEYIDRYHKWFIDDALHGTLLDGLEEYRLQLSAASKDEKVFEKVQDFLRKQIAQRFKQHPAFKTLFKKELIKNDLLNFDELSEEEKAVVKEFDSFTTYFTGFHENRENMYKPDAKHSSIAFRIVHENLPIFLGNIKQFEKIKENYPELVQEVQGSLQEHLLGATVEDMFVLDYFNTTLSQTYIDLYNQMIGGVKKDELKIQGFNEKINLYRQKNGLTKRDLPNLKPLHKQILSDRDTLSWLPEKFESMEELVSSVEEFYTKKLLEFECCEGKVNLLEKLPSLFGQTEHYDFSKIYIKNDRSLTDISQAVFKDVDKSRAYSIIKEALWEANKPKKSKDITADEEKFFNRKNSYFSIAQIQEALERADFNINVIEHFKNEAQPIVEQVEQTYTLWKQEAKNKKRVKAFLDAVLNFQHLFKPLKAPEEMDKDISFYALFDEYFGSVNTVTKLYDKVRNFMTKKPYSLEKFKFNFQNSTLLDGWDVNKEPDNTAILFHKEGLYYLGIMNKKHNKVFKNIANSDSSETYEKIDYKLLPGANKMLPKVFFSNKNIDYYNPSLKLLERYRAGDHKKGENFDLDFCHELIDFFKNSIEKHEDWRNFEYKFSPTKSYEDLSGFYREVEQQGYKISFKNIDETYIDTLVDEGKLYLFQIYNKDFSPYSKGTPNMHTLYWRALFDEQNLADVVYKLNGQAEVFYRKKSIEYSDEVMQKGHHAKDLADKFDYPIIKDRRFAFDKFQFHVPITLNFKAEGSENTTPKTLEFIQKNAQDIKVIGIDRGERHLLYLSLIDSNGEIVEQYSLNQIINSYNGKDHIIDYHEKLAKKESERDKARKEWGVIENIKELKEGYMSHVIHKIATLILEHNAIIVLEDLNFGFKRGRFKVEKQVYQKFEKALIDKLNYLVDKKRDKNELGGVFNALQLTNKFVSFEKMGKQNGFLFYVPAWNTSKIDPSTGFVNLFDTRYASVKKAKELFSKFASIRYNKSKNYFEFEVKNYAEFNQKAEGTRQNWLICSHGTRLVNRRDKDANNNFATFEVDPTQNIKDLFEKYSISLENELKEKVVAQGEKEFFEKLLKEFRLVLQMRNSKLNSTRPEDDYMISPVVDANGNFYDSRKAGDTLPKDADANGAYNIARKGLMLIERIKKASDLKKVDMAISNKDWLRYAQGMEK